MMGRGAWENHIEQVRINFCFFMVSVDADSFGLTNRTIPIKLLLGDDGNDEDSSYYARIREERELERLQACH